LLWPGSTPGAVFTLTNKEDEMEELIKALQEIHPLDLIYGITWTRPRWEIHVSDRWFNQQIGVRSVRKHTDSYDQHFIDYGNVRLFCMVKRNEPAEEVRTWTWDPASDEADTRQS
jgi:hypothetical protein